MIWISSWINRIISNGWVTLVCLVIFLLFTALVLPSQVEDAEAYSGEVGSPDTSFFYSAEELYQFAEAYEPQGRNAYIQARVTFNLVWPIVYFGFLGTAVSWAYKIAGKDGKFWIRLNLAPVFGLVFDYLENIAAAIVMARYPDLTPVISHLAGVFTAIKWLFIGGSFALLLIGLTMACWHWVRSKF